VVAWNPHPEMLPRLGAVAHELGLDFEAVSQQELGARADVIITITSAFEPLLMKDWIKPGTHIACMGTDTKGKQEVDPGLVAAATVFADEVAQSITIGEAQHAVAAGTLAEAAITPIGKVINGEHPGRTSGDEITLFDGTGVGLQDLAVASVAARLAAAAGKARRVTL
jgi:ornithine cyclodeaminase